MRTSILSAVALGLVLAAGSAYSADQKMPAGVMVMKGMIMDAKNMALYTYDRDTTPGKSSCNGMCLMNWPALKASDTDKDMGDWTVVTRDDGSKQWAYKGKPLYYYVQDKAPGEVTGDGRGMVWHVAKP